MSFDPRCRIKAAAHQIGVNLIRKEDTVTPAPPVRVNRKVRIKIWKP